MKYVCNCKTLCSILSAALLASFIISTTVWATGPRVTKSLLAPNKNQIYTDDSPPFATTDLATGGLSAEIIDAVLKISDVDAVQTILPLQSMVKYYLKQEKALAVYGRDLNFSEGQKKSLIYIPIAVSSEHYFYYKPAHKKGFGWDGGNLKSLKGFKYGAHKGEQVSKFRKAGIHVEYGRSHSLLEKLISKKIDFVSMPDLTAKWLLDRHFKNEKDSVAPIGGTGKVKPVFIIFNKKHTKGGLIAKKFKKGLAVLVKDGRYLQILGRYLKEKKEQTKYIKVLTKYTARYK